MLSGATIGPYRVLDKLGEGGMGQVFRARDTKLNRDVALKVLPDSFASDPDRLARFTREAQTLASLNHPNIAHIHGLEESAGVHALVMELVEGDDLSQRIARGAIPIDEALPIAKQIADALETAHEQGIIHRDLKPANIKVRGDGTVKVLDFGLAKAMEPAFAQGASAGQAHASISPTMTSPTYLHQGGGGQAVSSPGVILGTAAYMAPEQAKGRSVDRRADIWAFGVVLYEMVTGKPLFAGETVIETLAAVVTKAPDLSLAPASVRPLLEATLEPDPRRRLRDIGDAFRLLETASPRSEVRPRQPRALVMGLGATAIIASLVLAFIWTRKPATATPDPLRLQINLPAGAQPDAGMTLSPDGRHLAFMVANAAGELGLWVRDLDTLAARPVRGAENVATIPLFWSYDGRWLGFMSERGVQKVNVVEGGEPVAVTRTGQIGADVNAEGTMVFGTNPGRSANGGGGLFRLAAPGGDPVPLTFVDAARGEFAHHHPTFLPDGRRFLYLRAARPQDRSGIYVGSLDAKPEEQSTERLIATAYGPVFFVQSKTGAGGHLFFLRDNVLMAQPFDPERVALTGEPMQVASPVGAFIDRALFSVSREGTIVYTTSATTLTRQLTWVDRDGAVLNTVGSQATFNEVALSPDGTKAAVSIVDLLSAIGHVELWIWDLVRGTQTQIATGIAGAGTFSPVWSADNSRIAFVNGGDLYERPVTALEDARLLLRATPGDLIRPASWSPDARFILVSREGPQAGSDIWAVSRADGTLLPLIRTPALERDARFSPDGKWIAYAAREFSGQLDVFVTAIDASSPTLKVGGGPWRVSRGGGGNPRWRANGREIYYTNRQAVMVVPVFTDAGFSVGPATALPAFEADRLDFIDVSSDGKRLLAARPVETPTARAPVNVLLNWRPGAR